MTYTYEKRDGTIGIDSKTSFAHALNGQAVLEIESFLQVFETAQNLIRSENPDVSGNALSNVRGNWYEWLISFGFLEFHRQNNCPRLLLQLPNIRQYDCAQLYIPRITDYILDLREKVADSADVSLITSNPDFVIIDREVGVTLPDIDVGEVTSENIESLARTYLQAEDLCTLNQIVGYVAVKSSLRPDRRLQIAHEGSLMKALYKHVQTREWIIDAPGIAYYAISSKASEADKRALKTVATHSVTDVGSKPKAAVDELFCVANGIELKETLTHILM